MTAEPFTRLPASLVRRCGGDANLAQIAAHVDYRAQLINQRIGKWADVTLHRDKRGLVWVRASLAELTEATGQTEGSVKRRLAKLEELGVLARRQGVLDPHDRTGWTAYLDGARSLPCMGADCSHQKGADCSHQKGADCSHVLCSKKEEERLQKELLANASLSQRNEVDERSSLPFVAASVHQPLTQNGSAGSNGPAGGLAVIVGAITPAAAVTRERNPMWDVVCEVLGILDPSKVLPANLGRIGRLVKNFNAVDATPDDVRVRAEVYRRMWPTMSLTPEALLKHWDQLVPNRDTARIARGGESTSDRLARMAHTMEGKR